jgi:hypothetical protein
MVNRVPSQTDPSKTPSLDDFGGKTSTGGTKIDTSKGFSRPVVTPVEPYVPMPRPVTGEALITTGSTPVRIPVFVDTTSPRGVKVASDINSILNADRYSKSDANALWDQLPPETQNALTEIAKSQGGRSGKALWERSVSASFVSTKQGNPQNPWDFISAAGADVQSTGTGSRGGRAAAYTGPVESVSVQAETDIIATAQATAQALLGRTATEDEIQRILKQTRRAEQAQPTVQTRQGPGRVTTEEGLTKEGRDAILNKVLMSSPDYASYQFDSTVMDMMVNNLRRGQEVARGTF